jgi:hypothetical protein
MAVNAWLGGNMMQKVHPDSVAAFKCHRKYLINVEGFTPLSSRDLRAPDGSGVRVLTKQSHFGAVLRGGKSGDKSTSANRVMPMKGRSGVITRT